jgi:hypothetical protein
VFYFVPDKNGLLFFEEGLLPSCPPSKKASNAAKRNKSAFPW